MKNENCWYKVYVHIAPNDKKYVGITSHEKLSRRTGNNGEGYKTQTLFWRAIQKYGWDNFKHEIVAEHLTCEEALQMEINLIAKYQSNNPKYGYNTSVGGNGVKGGSLQAIDRERLSKKMSTIMKGKPSARKGQKLTDEHKQRISKSLIGHKHSEETKRKIGLKSIGRRMSDDGRKRMSEYAKRNKGKKWYNNGIVNKFAHEQPEGFVPGMLRRVTDEK